MNAPGSETGPGPQLVTWGKVTILSVDAFGFKFEYASNSANTSRSIGRVLHLIVLSYNGIASPAAL